MSNFNLEEQIRVLLNTVQLSYGFEQVPDIIENTATKTASYGSVYYCLKAMNGDAVIEVARGINNNIVLSNYTIKDGDEFKCNLKSVKLTSGNVIAYKKQSGYKEVPSADVAPENVTAPIVTGTAVVGETLTTTDGTWTGTPEPTFSYQWYRGATLISGATNSTYTLVQADAGNTSNIKCVVTATNGAGSASADSNTVAQILTVRTNAFITASGITDATIRGGLNTFDIGLISNSLDTKMKAVYPFVGGTASTHRWNFMDARDLDAAFRLFFIGTWAHTLNGALPNGTTAYANTYLSPNANQTATSGHFSIYSRTSVASSNQFGSSGVRDASPVRSSTLTIRRQDSSRAASMWGEGANDSVSAGSETDARGFYIVSRTASNSLKLYKNANTIGTVTGTQTTTTLSSNFYFLSVLNSGGSPLATTYDNKEIAFSSIGAGLTDSEVTIFESLVNSLNTELGRSILVGNAGVIGDSTIASYLAQNSVASYVLVTGTTTDISTPGDTINQQLTRWNNLSSGVKSSMNYVFVQIGLNDLNPAENAATALGRYQSLINQINTDTSAKIILGTMTPCKERLTDVYGPVNGLISYQKWLDMNEAIKGNGPNAITGADAVATRHTDILNDGNGNLAPIYEVAGTNDHIHENNAGRIIIAHSWRSKA